MFEQIVLSVCPELTLKGKNSSFLTNNPLHLLLLNNIIEVNFCMLSEKSLSSGSLVKIFICIHIFPQAARMPIITVLIIPQKKYSYGNAIVSLTN